MWILCFRRTNTNRLTPVNSLASTIWWRFVCIRNAWGCTKVTRLKFCVFWNCPLYVFNLFIFSWYLQEKQWIGEFRSDQQLHGRFQIRSWYRSSRVSSVFSGFLIFAVSCLRELLICADMACALYVDGVRPRHSNAQERLEQIQNIGKRFGINNQQQQQQQQWFHPSSLNKTCEINNFEIKFFKFLNLAYSVYSSFIGIVNCVCSWFVCDSLFSDLIKLVDCCTIGKKRKFIF